MAEAVAPASVHEDAGRSEIEGILLTVDDRTFSEDDWNVVVGETEFLGSNWQKVVICLGLSHDYIDSIKNEASDSQRSKALNHWIKQNYNTKKYGEPSWRTLLKAVAQVNKRQFKALAGEHKVEPRASTTSEEHKVTDSKDEMVDIKQVEALSEVAVSVSTSNSKLYSWSELTFHCDSLNLKGLSKEKKQQLYHELCTDAADISYKFQNFFSATTDSLHEREIPVKELARHLECLGHLKPTFKKLNSKEVKVLGEDLQELEKIESVREAMSVISHYCSFFNYRMLEHIINKLGAEEDRENLARYKEDFTKYGERHVFKCPEVVGEMREEGQANMFVILDESFDKCNVSHLSAFVSNLAQILNIPAMILKLYRIGPGSLKLFFQLPLSLPRAIFPLSRDQESALAGLGITHLSCGVYQFTGKKKDVEDPATDEDSGPIDNRHLKECDFQPVQCKFCGENFMKKDLDEHKNLKPTPEQLFAGCSKAKIRCSLCKTEHRRQDLKAHLNENPAWDHRNEGCANVRLKCKFCQETFARKDLEDHLNLDAVGEAQLRGCELAQLSCSYCKAPMLRRELSFHLNLRPKLNKRSWEKGCNEAVIHCVSCNRRVKRSELGNHLNSNPSPENWLEGCDVADVKCIYCKEEYRRWQLKVKAKKMEDTLDKNYLKAVFVTSSIAKEKWYEIGLELKVDAKELDQLKVKYKGSANECFYETIRIWLESKEQKSWNTIVHALCRVGMQAEAKDVERSVICEDALMKTTGEYIKSTEEKIAKVEELLEHAKQLSKEYDELRQPLKVQEGHMTQLNVDLDKLQKKFEEQAIANVAKELEATKSKIDSCKKELTRVEKEIASAREALREALKNITLCESHLSKAKQDVENCTEKLDRQSEDLIRERDIKFEHPEKKISAAKKWGHWGLGGLALLVAGGVAAVASGPAAPVVFGLGLAVASWGAATALVATGVGIHFKRDKLNEEQLNEEQKKIYDDYAPIAENCSKTLDRGKKMAENARTLLEKMRRIANEYEKLQK